jgi:FlaA1/EpsC-like NDP-sugar epimerase
MIELSGARVDVDIPIKVVGIRPGEKLQEDLREPEEEILKTEHPFIARLIPITSPPAWLESCMGQLADATDQGDGDRVRRLLFAIAGVSLEDIPDLIELDREPAGFRPEAGGA